MNNLIILLTFGEFLLSVLDVIKNILIFVLVLGLIVGIHEFGHFIFARRAKILVREFAIGMGPVLWQKKKGEVNYSLRAIPIGGFCSIAGEEVELDPFDKIKDVKLLIVDGVVKVICFNPKDATIESPIYTVVNYDILDKEETGNLFLEVTQKDSDNLTTTYEVASDAILKLSPKMQIQIAPYNRTLSSKPKRKRAMVMFGGPLMNFLLALLVFFIVGIFTGFADLSSNRVSNTEKNNYPISEYLEDGDEIIALKTKTLGEKDNINTWNQISDYMKNYDKNNLDEDIIVTVRRGDKISSYTITTFIAINSAGFGSTFDYNETGDAKVGVCEEIKELGDNTQLKLNDIIIGISAFNVTYIADPNWAQIRNVFANYVGDSENAEENKIFLKVLRERKDDKEKVIVDEIDIYVIPYSKALLENQTTINGQKVPTTSATIGLSPEYKFSLGKSFLYAGERTWGSLTAVLDTLKLLFGGTVSIKSLSGPVGIFSITKEASEYGILYILSLLGLLSVNIGFLNLLPIPALDGGRLLFLGYEAITKKKPNPKVETTLILVTMVLLMGLMIYVTFGDILRLFG